MEKGGIKLNPALCTQCLCCQLRCSLQYSGAFNPSKARIIIEPGKISFSDECVENCYLCSRYCMYGAISPE